MRNFFAGYVRSRRGFRVWLLLLFSLYAVQVGAQGVLQANTGTIEAMAQDDGRITISGRVYGYDDEVTEVFLRGERISSSVLDPGMVVRFTVNAQGTLLRVEVLGPFDELRLLEQH